MATLTVKRGITQYLAKRLADRSAEQAGVLAKAADRLIDELLDAGQPEAPPLPPGFVCQDCDGLA